MIFTNGKEIFPLKADILQLITKKKVLLCLSGSFILAFGMYNIHSVSGITEGGTLGLTLLFENLFGISPSVSEIILNIICYAVGIKTLGKPFLIYSLISTAFFSIAYRICEFFPPLFPDIASYPLLAAITGAVFVGIGVGLCVKAGGAVSGDDALAMSISKVSPLKIQHVYLISDITVLLLSLTYIPFNKIVYSLLTVVISGQIIGFIDKIKAQDTVI